MELVGSAYLFNLSLVAMTFAAVSALVMLVRQTMGGKLSNFDIFLVTLYVALGFAAGVNAILPPLIALLHFSEAVTWVVASLLAAAVQAMTVLHLQLQRPKAAAVALPLMAIVAYSVHWMAVVLLRCERGRAGVSGSCTPCHRHHNIAVHGHVDVRTPDIPAPRREARRGLGPEAGLRTALACDLTCTNGARFVPWSQPDQEARTD